MKLIKGLDPKQSMKEPLCDRWPSKPAHLLEGAEQRSIASSPRWIGCEWRQGRAFFKALQPHLHGDLGAEAAGVGFAGGEGAVFPELVAAVAPAAGDVGFAGDHGADAVVHRLGHPVAHHAAFGLDPDLFKNVNPEAFVARICFVINGLTSSKITALSVVLSAEA